MQFLSTDLILDLQKMLLNQFGGLHGLRDKHLLESALAYPQMLHSIGMEKNIHLLAASYCFHLIKNHAFIDGNKRIGTLAMITFLKINGYIVHISHEKLYDIAMQTANSKICVEKIARELKKYTTLVGN